MFAAHRVDEQIAKGLDRKVWLPSGGYLVIDRTEAMIVVDVNTGKFTGSGGNLEETVTKNNLEAAEEIVRQLRLRDLGGMIVIDFIDMVLESNRELVLRRLTECLGRDRTKHQVAEVTSLGLVQMTRKRVGQGLHEAFTETCEHCNGRGFRMRSEPVEARPAGSGATRLERFERLRWLRRFERAQGRWRPRPRSWWRAQGRHREARAVSWDDQGPTRRRRRPRRRSPSPTRPPRTATERGSAARRTRASHRAPQRCWTRSAHALAGRGRGPGRAGASRRPRRPGHAAGGEPPVDCQWVKRTLTGRSGESRPGRVSLTRDGPRSYP